MSTSMRCNLPSPLLYAHRGAAAELPENTLPSFQRALTLGAGALEMDLHMTSDGVIVVSHDPDGRRLAGVRRNIRECTLEEVKAWDVGGPRFRGQGFRIPTFEQVLRDLPPVPINIDVKQRRPMMVEPLLELIARYRAEQRVLIASFDAATLQQVRRRGYRGSTALGQSEVLRLLALPAFVLRNLRRRGDAAQIPTRVGPFSLGEEWVIDRCHAAGLRVDYWTVNQPDEARRLLDLGADGIMTDDPGAIAPVFAQVGGFPT